MRAAIAVLCVLGLVLVTILWPRTADEVPPVAPIEAAGAAEATPIRELESSTIEPGDAVARESMPPPPPSAALEEGPLTIVQVVGARSGLPVPGAEVLYMHTAGAETYADADMLDLDDLDVDPERTLRSYGRVAVADERGRAECRDVDDSHSICARDGRLFGLAEDHSTEEVVRITLERDVNLTVLVTDAEGAILPDVEVLLRGSPVYHPETTESEQIGTTDPRGLLVLRHVQRRVPDWRRLPLGTPDIRVGVALPGLAEEHALPDHGGPDHRVHIQLEPWGSVAVRVEDGEGNRVRRGVRLALGLIDRQHLRRLDVASEERAIVWDHVPLHRRLLLRGTVRSRRIEREIEGPVRGGEQVAITLRTQTIEVVVTGRVVDARGTPVPWAKVNLFGRVPDGASQENRPDGPFALGFAGLYGAAKAARDGRFRVAIAVDQTQPRVAELVLTAHEAGAAPAHIAATHPMGTLAAGTHDVGDLVLGEESDEFLVSGRFASAGTPVAPTFETEACRCADGDHTWVRVRSGATPDSTGRFEIRGAVTGHARLHVRDPRWVAVVTEFTPGARDLSIELTRAGLARIAVAMDDGVPLGQLTVALRDEEGTSADGWLDSETRNLGAERITVVTFGWNRLAPGGYRFEVTSGDAVLATREIEVVAEDVVELVGDEWVDLRGKVK